MIATLVALSLTMLGCTVSSFDRTRVAGGQEKVSAVQVFFQSTAMVPTQVQTTAKGIAGIATSGAQNQIDQGTASGATGQFRQVFADGFANRFPGLAAKYGLAVSPTAAAQLRVRIAGQKTYCYVRCQSRLVLNGELRDASGRTIWRFDTTVGQATSFSDISSATFDAFAVELLGAMKADGLIG